jgi:hypothetical protein
MHFALSGSIVAENLKLHLETGFNYLLPAPKDLDNLRARSEENVHIKCVTS